MGNILLGLMFVLYLAKYKPFIEDFDNKLQLINEIVYVILAYHQLMFTDYVTEAETKSMVGWSWVMVALVNLVFPNLYLVIDGMWPDIKRSCRGKRKRTPKEI